MHKPVILFRWSDSSRATQDNRDEAARIIRAHRASASAYVLYCRATHRIEVGLVACPDVPRGIWTRL